MEELHIKEGNQSINKALFNQIQKDCNLASIPEIVPQGAAKFIDNEKDPFWK